MKTQPYDVFVRRFGRIQRVIQVDASTDHQALLIAIKNHSVDADTVETNPGRERQPGEIWPDEVDSLFAEPAKRD